MTEKKTIENRSEILFLYDISYANPNGDPNDENKPRIDEESGINIVTDVRLKRTIRDYLYEHRSESEEILVREIEKENGTIQDGKTRAEDFLFDEDGNKINKKTLKDVIEMRRIIKENIINSCIDVRLFGATLPIEKKSNEKSSITLTGPVQFKMGRSLHKVKLQFVKGTGAFASDNKSLQKTFREEYVLPYSLIAFYGVINENAANDTRLSETDIQKMLEAMWNGTKSLITRSKMGQQPRLLLRIVFKKKEDGKENKNKGNFHIGELDKYLTCTHKKGEPEEAIRDIQDAKLDFSPLVQKLSKETERIEHIEYFTDERFIQTLSNEEKDTEQKDILVAFLKAANVEVKMLSL